MNNSALTSVKPRIVNASTPKDSQRRKALRQRGVPRRPGCRGCPLRSSFGACRDTALKSGRCGDWVWFVLHGNHQFRRRWVKPNDPRTLRPRRWRARLSAASSRYSHSLTEVQQDACIVAGAKRRSRPRLGQSGALTGQQYSVGKECAAYARAEASKVTMARAKVPQPHRHTKTHLLQAPQHQRVARGTWGPHRGMAAVSPGSRRRDKGLRRNDECRRKNAKCERRRPALRVPIDRESRPRKPASQIAGVL